MDRRTVYFGQVPLETDLLLSGQHAMVGLAKLAEAVFGTPTFVDGFTVTPTTPASLNVLLTAGSILQVENLEATNWSSVNADTSHSIVKQGILLDAATFGITPPGTVGFSQVYLIEVQYADLDAGSTVLPYYNAANPALPYSGPGNAGTAQNTVRKGIVASQVKAGTAAATGTQVAPSADAGWTGLFTVTVANGQSTITSGNIAVLPSAPFLATNGKLPQIPVGVQNGTWVYAADTGTANALVVTLTPTPVAYVAGMSIDVKVANAITGAATINVNGLGNRSIKKNDGTDPAGAVVSGEIIPLVYDGTNFQIKSSRYIIDTALTKTVHGGGADFADMIAALEWLSRYTITQNGSVTFNIAAGRFTYTGSVIVDHPNTDKITIAGAVLLAAPPTRSGFTVSGVSSGSDQTADLTYLRTIYATELHFNGGNGVKFERGGGVTFKRILCTGDGTAPAGLGDGILIDAPGVVLAGGVSVHGFGAHGLNIRAPTTEFTGAVTASGNILDGICLQEGGQLFYIAEVCSMSNGATGISCTSAVFRPGAGGTSPASAEGNATNGALAQNGSSFGVSGSGSQFSFNGQSGILATQSWVNVVVTCSGNLQWGIFGVEAKMFTQSCVLSANVSGSIFATSSSFVDASSATGVAGSSSPAVNTLGNNQSYIIN